MGQERDVPLLYRLIEVKQVKIMWALLTLPKEVERII